MPPLNLEIKFGEDLIIGHLRPNDALLSLRRVFDRDFIVKPCTHFLNKEIIYVREGNTNDKVFEHVTMKQEYGKRHLIDNKRAIRIHWIKTILEKAGTSKSKKYQVFSHVHPKHGLKTYVYHKNLKHLIILEPSFCGQKYYFVTAYHVSGTGLDDIREKFENKLSEVK
jgi:hypothetical protein